LYNLNNFHIVKSKYFFTHKVIYELRNLIVKITSKLHNSQVSFYIYVMNENEVGPKVGAEMPIKNQGHVTQDLPEDKCRKSTRTKFVSSKLREFE